MLTALNASHILAAREADIRLVVLRHVHITVTRPTDAAVISARNLMIANILPEEIPDD
jgi:hypothetical protein